MFPNKLNALFCVRHIKGKYKILLTKQYDAQTKDGIQFKFHTVHINIQINFNLLIFQILIQ
jgi:hypothetical protein